MSHYLIRNETDSDIVLEDIGVRLSGRGATANVEPTVFESSSSVKSAAGRISSQFVRTSAVWPFSLRRPQTPSAALPPAALPPPIPVPVDASNSELSRKIDGLMLAISSLKPSGVMEPSHHPSSVTTATPRDRIMPPADPVFIPSSIVPKDASMNVRLETLETDRPDIDESADALRRLRGKK